MSVAGIPRITPQQRLDFLLEEYNGRVALPPLKRAYRPDLTPFNTLFHIFPSVPDLDWCRDFIEGVIKGKRGPGVPPAPMVNINGGVKVETAFEVGGSGMLGTGIVVYIQGVPETPENRVRLHLGQVLVDMEYEQNPDAALNQIRRMCEGKGIL